MNVASIIDPLWRNVPFLEFSGNTGKIMKIAYGTCNINGALKLSGSFEIITSTADE